MKILIDAMGGDNAPQEIVRGALLAHDKFGAEIVLIGQREQIAPLDRRVKGKRNKNLAISERSLALIDTLMDKEVFHCEDHR